MHETTSVEDVLHGSLGDKDLFALAVLDGD